MTGSRTVMELNNLLLGGGIASSGLGDETVVIIDALGEICGGLEVAHSLECRNDLA